MAEWPKAPISLFCDSSAFEPSHGTYQHATLTMGGDFWHSSQYTLTCGVWTDSVRYMSICVANEKLPSFGGNGEEISAIVRTMVLYRKVVGVQTCQSPFKVVGLPLPGTIQIERRD